MKRLLVVAAALAALAWVAAPAQAQDCRNGSCQATLVYPAAQLPGGAIRLEAPSPEACQIPVVAHVHETYVAAPAYEVVRTERTTTVTRARGSGLRRVGRFATSPLRLFRGACSGGNGGGCG